VQADGSDDDRPAIHVVARVVDDLNVDGGEDAAIRARRVIRLGWPSPRMKPSPPNARYSRCNSDSPFDTNAMPTLSFARPHSAPLTSAPTSTVLSISVYANDSLLPSDQPKRANAWMFVVSSCSTFTPKPYFVRPTWREALMSGVGGGSPMLTDAMSSAIASA
jgi:hypothetical protein